MAFVPFLCRDPASEALATRHAWANLAFHFDSGFETLEAVISFGPNCFSKSTPFETDQPNRRAFC